MHLLNLSFQQFQTVTIIMHVFQEQTCNQVNWDENARTPYSHKNNNAVSLSITKEMFFSRPITNSSSFVRWAPSCHFFLFGVLSHAVNHHQYSLMNATVEPSSACGHFTVRNEILWNHVPEDCGVLTQFRRRTRLEKANHLKGHHLTIFRLWNIPRFCINNCIR